MLSKPISAKNPERVDHPEKHSTAGDVEDWFSSTVLNQFDLTGVTVDFFVDWSNNTLSNELWVKRVVFEEILESTSNEVIQELIYSCDSEQFVKDLANLAKLTNSSLKYKLFRESTNWETLKENSEPILSVDINDVGKVVNVERVKLETLKEQIRMLSGGPAWVGKKGLTYSTTKLEYVLSMTDSAWPGDVDFILLNNEKKPIAILEFKKHTLSSKIEAHKFEKYYYEKFSDRKKYNRLAILRDYLKVPLLVLYYPTRKELDYIIIEEVIGRFNKLKAGKEVRLALPVNEVGKRNLIREITKMLK
ncbi:UNVERIFIED_ORG: hypothetical protein ABIC97_004139 [Peribacillus simplex]